MKVHRHILLITFVLVSHTLLGQGLSVKGYLGMRAMPSYWLYTPLNPQSVSVLYNTDASVMAMVALAFENAKGNFGEIGFTSQSNKNGLVFSAFRLPPNDSLVFVDAGTERLSSLNAYLEYSWLLKTHGTTPWQLYLGCTVDLGRMEYDFTPLVPYLYAQEHNTLWLRLGLVPRAQYAISPNLQLDMSISAFVLNYEREHSRIYNPALTPNQQKFDVNKTSFMPQYWLRAGLAWRIVPMKKTTK